MIISHYYILFLTYYAKCLNQFLKADSLYYIGWDISIQHPQTYVGVVMKRQKQQRVFVWKNESIL